MRDFYVDDDGTSVVSGVRVTGLVIEHIYREFCAEPKRTITSIVWWKADFGYDRFYGPVPDYQDDAKRVIWELAANDPYIDPVIYAMYILALKYDDLQILETLEHVTEIETLCQALPQELDIMWVDQEKLIRFYNKYKTSKLPKMNKIKIPEGLQIEERNS